MGKEDSLKKVQAAAGSISDAYKADILIYNGEIERQHSLKVINLIRKANKRKNLFFILVTRGGSADAAYRMARCFQQNYEKFIVFVPGYCKSAGTLIVIGAHEIVMSDEGELGPLDIQLAKSDELFEMSSGLTVMSALSTLQNKAFSMFEQTFLTLKAKSGGKITLKTAMEISSNLTQGLFGRIYQQIEPNYLGEVGLAMNIANEYGNRLNKASKNLKDGAIASLTAAYPAHGFVIDRDEASELFSKVRKPTADEISLSESLNECVADISYDQIGSDEPLIDFISKELGKDAIIGSEGDENHEKQGQESPGENTVQEGSGAVQATGDTGTKLTNGTESIKL